MVLVAALPYRPALLLDALLIDFEQDGTTHDLQVRQEAWAVACEAGHAVACEAASWRSGGPIAPDRARAALSESCDAGEPASCLAMGWLLSQARFGAPDPSRGAMLMQGACEAGLTRACMDWAVALITAGTDPALGDQRLSAGCDAGEAASCREKGRRDGDVWLLERGCLLGDAVACRLAGQALLGGPSPGRAWTLLEAGCQRRDAESCLIAARAGRADWPVALLTAGCAAYNTTSCGRLASLYAAGAGVGQSNALAGQFHRIACTHGETGSCDMSDGPVGVPDFHRLRCERGDPAGCQRLGRQLRAEEPLRAREILAAGCEMGSDAACSDLGWLHAEEQDFGTAGRLWEDACESGVAGACVGLGGLIRGGQGRKSDLSEAAAFDLRACALDASRCQTAAWLTLRGLGTQRDVATAVGFTEAACAAGEQAACTDLGWRLSVGQGTDPDPAAALSLWQVACAAGEQAACTALVFQEAVDPETLRSPCEGGEASACAGLGIAYATGKGLTPDRTYGLSLLEGACAAERVCVWGVCDGDGAVACRWLGHMYTQGAGVKTSRREARLYYRRACDLGDLLSCGG